MNNGVISIGGSCIPRMTIKSTLNFTKKGGYKTCPFDLLFSTFKGACYNIKNDFSDFFDGLHIIQKCPSNCITCRNSPFKNKGLISNNNGIIFEHESPTHAHLFNGGDSMLEWAKAKGDIEFFIRNNFEELKQKYLIRINNFRKTIKENKRIILIRSKYPGENPPSEEEIKDLITGLEQKYIGKKFIFFDIDSSKQSLSDVFNGIK